MGLMSKGQHINYTLPHYLHSQIEGSNWDRWIDNVNKITITLNMFTFLYGWINSDDYY